MEEEWGWTSNGAGGELQLDQPPTGEGDESLGNMQQERAIDEY
jgi:hypothetical protein